MPVAHGEEFSAARALLVAERYLAGLCCLAAFGICMLFLGQTTPPEHILHWFAFETKGVAEIGLQSAAIVSPRLRACV